MRISKLTLIIEIDKEMTELFKVKPRPNFRKDDKNMNWTSSVPFLRRRSVCLSLNLSTIFQTIIWWKYVWDQGYYIHINTNNISWHPPPGNHISHRQPQGQLPGSISSARSRRLGDKMEAKWCQMSEVVQFIERERKTVPIKTFLHF